MTQENLMAAELLSNVLLLRLQTDKFVLIPLMHTFESKPWNYDFQETRKFAYENSTVHELLFINKMTCVSRGH